MRGSEEGKKNKILFTVVLVIGIAIQLTIRYMFDGNYMTNRIALALTISTYFIIFPLLKKYEKASE